MKEKQGRIRKIVLFITFLLIILLNLMPITVSDDQINLSFDPYFNYPPKKPTLINPMPTGIEIESEDSATLTVYVEDQNNDSITVYFYYAYNDSLIGSTTVSNNSNASIGWGDLSASTTYNWYAIANDSYLSNRSDTWSFKTKTIDTPSGNNGGSSSPIIPYVPSVNIPPVANITGPDIWYKDSSFILSANYSYDPDGEIIGYRWDFNNDGLFDTDWLEEEIISYYFNKTGDYRVKLQVKDNLNAKNISYHNITIIEIDKQQIPVVKIDGPYEGDINQNINFNSNGTYDPDGNITKYSWDFGDKNVSYDENPIHSYEKPGRYIVILQVSDDDNLTNLAITTANIYENKTKDEPDMDTRELPFQIITVIATISSVTIILLVLFLKHRQITLMIEKIEIKKHDKIVDKKKSKNNKKTKKTKRKNNKKKKNNTKKNKNKKTKKKK